MSTERPTSFYIDKEADELLVRLCAETGMSRSAIVREAIKSMAENDQMTQVRQLVRELSRVVSGK
jgi:predicted DNA-binding protein